MATDDQETKKREESVLSAALERFRIAEEASNDFRNQALDDLKFLSGEQWPIEVKHAREMDRRPCLTINRLPQFVRQVTNDQRQNRPAIKVYPVDDNADIDTAKILQGMIRHIEYNSNADVAYDTAFEGAVKTGLGWFRVLSDYCDHYSFNQELFIKRIPNCLSVYFDPNSLEPDGSDAEWAFISEDMSWDSFKAQFPKAEHCSYEQWESVGNPPPLWANEKTVRVVEYFYKEFEPDRLLQVVSPDGATESVLLSDLERSGGLPQGFVIQAERETMVPRVKWCKLTGGEILEKTDWPGKWIPIIPVYGDEYIVDGRRVIEGIIRHAKDPQRMYNYWASSETETIALAPRAPWIGAEGQFEGHEAQWKTANIRNHAYLEYKPKTLGGQPVGPPQRNVFEAPTQAITQARMLASDDLKATTGIYDAALGNRSNENSGVAIQRRAFQAQTSNFHFVDNLSRSIRHGGRILLDLIPKIYDTARAQRIIGEDNEQQIVKINALFEKQGEQKFFNLSIGKYDAVCEAGPSFATKRQDAAQSMLEMSKANPQLMQIAGDLMVKNMDWPGSTELADRLKKTLPPGLADQDDKNKKPLPPEVQAQMQQMSQMIENLTHTLDEQSEVIKAKRMEIESRERIEMKKLEVEVELKMAEMGSKESLAVLQHEIAQISQRLDLLNISAPIDSGIEQTMPDQQMSDDHQLTGEYPPGLTLE